MAILGLTLFGDTVTTAVAVGCAIAALLVPAALNVNYALALAGRPRSAERARGDRKVAIGLLVAIPLPLGHAAAAIHVDALRVWSSVLAESSIRAFVACAITVAVTVVLLSSTTDWYAIKAWRDGIVAEPPCRREKRSTWLNVTRWWLIHRIVATVGFFIALTVVINLAWFELARRATDDNWLFLVGLVSPPLITAIAMGGYTTNMRDAVGLAIGNLKLAIGDTVSFTHHGRSVTGIAYDISIDGGYRVIERDGSSRYLSLGDVRQDRGVDISQGRPPQWACDAACLSEIDDACDFRAVRDRPSTHWLIV